MRSSLEGSRLRALASALRNLFPFAASRAVPPPGEIELARVDGTKVASSQVDRWIPQWMEEAGIPGLSVAVVRGSAIVYRRAFGLRAAEPRVPVDPGTLFEAASLSKPVFAYAVLQLAAEGSLDLDEPLCKHLVPEDIRHDDRSRLITPRMILEHSSGLPNWRRNQPLSILFTPGSRFSYSGEGYMYLQQAVETIVGKDLSRWIEERVFRPLGMSRSHFRWSRRMEANVATGYDRAGVAKKKWRPSKAWAAGSLHTTAEDYARFLSALMESGGPPGAVAAQMMRPRQAIAGYGGRLSWGLGMGLQSTPDGLSFWHWGSNDGFKSLIVGHWEQKTALVYLTNGDHGLDIGERMAHHILGGQYPAFLWLHDEHGYPAPVFGEDRQ